MRQYVTIPPGTTATLQFWTWTWAQPNPGADRQEAILLAPDNSVLAVLWRTETNEQTWRQVAINLSAYAGRSVAIYFNVYNDGAGGLTSMFLDNVQLLACGVSGPPPGPVTVLPPITVGTPTVLPELPMVPVAPIVPPIVATVFPEAPVQTLPEISTPGAGALNPVPAMSRVALELSPQPPPTHETARHAHAVPNSFADPANTAAPSDLGRDHGPSFGLALGVALWRRQSSAVLVFLFLWFVWPGFGRKRNHTATVIGRARLSGPMPRDSGRSVAGQQTTTSLPSIVHFALSLERGSRLNFTLYSDETGFAALRGEWNDLLRRSRFDTIFLTWEWQTTWWRTLGAPRGPLYILAAREAERLVGILPLYLTSDDAGRTLRVVGCFEVADYLDLIIEAGQEEAVYRAFLDWLVGPEAPAWDALDLCNQPMLSLAHSRLPELARERGWSAEVTQEDVCPVIALPTQVLGRARAQMGGRRTWRRWIRRSATKSAASCAASSARRRTPSCASCAGKTASTDAVNAFIALHRLSRRDKDAFMDEQMQGFFHALAATCAEHGWLQLSFLEVGGEPIASYFCFEYKNEVLVYNSGYDPQAYSQLSPGWVLLARLIQEAIAQGCARFDFLQGNEDYKHRFGGVDEPVYRTLIRR